MSTSLQHSIREVNASVSENLSITLVLNTPRFTRWCIGLVLAAFLQIGITAQSAFPAPNFTDEIVKGFSGEILQFTVSNLPDPKDYGDQDGELELQINWQLGNECGNGSTFSEKVKISNSTFRIQTGYRLSDIDDGKKIKINVSFFKPSDKADVLAEGLIAATSQCTTLKISKS